LQPCGLAEKSMIGYDLQQDVAKRRLKRRYLITLTHMLLLALPLDNIADLD